MTKAISTLLSTTLVVLSGQLVSAGSATWDLNPVSDDWNTAANWTPATIPNGTNDIASFGVSNTTNIFLMQASDTVKALTFNPGASAFTISVGGPVQVGNLTITGGGVRNNSATTQTVVTVGVGLNTSSTIKFLGAATAGTNMLYLNNPLSQMSFLGTSSAGDASFVNQSGSLGLGSGGAALLNFEQNSTAANGTFTNKSGGTDSSQIFFFDDATAGNGSFTNEGGSLTGCLILLGDDSTAGTATFINEGNDDVGAAMEIVGNASADHGSFTFQAGMPNRLFSASQCTFEENATAGDATFTIEGSTAAGAPPAILIFSDTSTAGNSTLIATNGPSPATGGVITFLANSLGGTARIELSGPVGSGTLSIQSHNAPGVTVGSIEGGGSVVLGTNHNLTVGSNNLSTTFSGAIKEGQNGTGGSLTKIGTGTLTLTGVNTYTGGTTISGGALLVSNKRGSGTGTGTIHVNAGMLGGSGTITGAVTVGTGSGPAAFLAPAGGSNVPSTFTTSGSVTFLADATYTYTAKATGTRRQTDALVANGATISGASFSFRPKIAGTLQAGTTFTVISNTSASPIGGTFNNLADGAIITAGGANFQANYEGGDGNDLTLTVVP